MKFNIMSTSGKCLCIPWNNDLNLIDKIIERKDSIHEVYGCDGMFLSGRVLLKKLEPKEFLSTIKRLQDNDIKFNYTLNLPAIMYHNSIQTNLIPRLKELIDNGLSTITVSSFLLARTLKDLNINFKEIVGSTFIDATNDSVDLLKECGFTRVVISERITHKIPVLKSFINECDKNHIETELLVNNDCLSDCPYRDDHRNFKVEDPIFIHKYNCIVTDSSTIVKRSIIPPSVIEMYENIGIKYFKISDRNDTTEHITSLIDYYTERQDVPLGKISSLFNRCSALNMSTSVMKPFFQSLFDFCPGTCWKCTMCDEFGNQFQNKDVNDLFKQTNKVQTDFVKNLNTESVSDDHKSKAISIGDKLRNAGVTQDEMLTMIQDLLKDMMISGKMPMSGIFG